MVKRFFAIVNLICITLFSIIGCSNSSDSNNSNNNSSNISQSKEDLMYAHKLIGGYWKSADEYTLTITTKNITEYNMANHQQENVFEYEILSLKKNAQNTIVNVKFKNNQNTLVNLVFDNNGLSHMTFKIDANNFAKTYQDGDETYHNHLENNVNYITLRGHMGIGFYLDTTSIQINPNDKNANFSWTENVINANMDNGGQRSEPQVFNLSVRNGRPYINNNLLNLNDTSGATELSRQAFLVGYFYATGQNFEETNMQSSTSEPQVQPQQQSNISPPVGNHWIRDINNGAYLWNPEPKEGESVAWSGGYIQDGEYRYAHGSGSLTWYRNGRVIQYDEGTFDHGRHHGQFKHTFPSGRVIYSNWNYGREI